MKFHQRSITRQLKQQQHAISYALKTRPMPSLDLPKLDKRWQRVWGDAMGRNLWVDKKSEGAKKAYVLPMFPYPSGDLHLGHLRVYTISDVLARFKHMQGFDVMHPIGWDAFGLPAENAAIERGVDPAKWTKSNIERMKGQLQAMNGHWDWDREFATCDPSFYKHTQRLFLLLHELGYAYQAESFVNYDPVDKTVLANEQVDANGNSWRSGAKVEKRLLKQWFFKISEFRQELLDDLKHLAKDSAWPERVLAMQKNWIGKSEGARIKFPIVTSDNKTTQLNIEVFTTRPDTLFGVQYIALAGNHPIVRTLAEKDPLLQSFLDTLHTLSPDSKVGYLLSSVRATNPLAYEKTTPEATKASVPIFVAPYVLGDYGDGAVMGVPGHDTRDHAFWMHNCSGAPVRMVIGPSPRSTIAAENQPFVHHGQLTSHSGPLAGHTTATAATKIVKILESKGFASFAESWRLRDWLVSRQRYWGTPIPIIHCETCGPVPVPEDDLPVELPPVQDHWEKRKTGNPLNDAHDWVNTSCPKCGQAAKRDTDTMDTFVDSSWYFMRFPDPDNYDALFSPEAADASLPVDIYIGGVEHAILHLLYARFISKFLATTHYWPAGSNHQGEPFKKVLAQGMVHGKTFSDPITGRFLKPDEVDLEVLSKPVISATGQTPKISYEKMSKSKYNGVDPGTCMGKYGADATRAHILFQAPVSEVLEWDEERISGVTRWLRRIHEHVNKFYPLWATLDPHMNATAKSVLLERQEAIDMHIQVLASIKAKEIAPKLSLGLLDESGKIIPPYSEKYKPAVELALHNLRQSLELDKKLWRTVQRTITNVTEAYSKSYSLNTVVSDLMSLSNVIIDSSSIQPQRPVQAWAGLPTLHPSIMRLATIDLLKMMAPITPAFAEECWSDITIGISAPRDNIYGKLAFSLGKNVPFAFKPIKSRQRSIFNEPFPEADNTYTWLAPQTQKCAIQVNGKLRLVVNVPVPTNITGKALEQWIVKEILATKEGKEKLSGVGKGAVD
ncbi:Mitochondrial leucine--tRNA ligase, partial [Lachnellula suecica]